MRVPCRAGSRGEVDECGAGAGRGFRRRDSVDVHIARERLGRAFERLDGAVSDLHEGLFRGSLTRSWGSAGLIAVSSAAAPADQDLFDLGELMDALRSALPAPPRSLAAAIGRRKG